MTPLGWLGRKTSTFISHNIWSSLYVYVFNFTALWANSADDKLIMFLIFPRKQDLTFHANCLRAWNIHYENMPIQIYWKFYHQKMKIFW